MPWAERELILSWAWACPELSVGMHCAEREQTLSWGWAYPHWNCVALEMNTGRTCCLFLQGWVI